VAVRGGDRAMCLSKSKGCSLGKAKTGAPKMGVHGHRRRLMLITPARPGMRREPLTRGIEGSKMTGY
jgi:hypothetical protein